MSVNYISSAGTGKTYSLVKEVLDKIKKENLSIKDILILTFTDKAASELKEKIATKIKEEILQNQILEKEKLHKEILHIDNAYIGTFHSVFFKLLKRYPLESKIDSTYQIINSNLDEYLNLWFENWIEQDFHNDTDTWKKILENISIDYKNIKKIFNTLYKNKTKLKNTNKNLKSQEEQIQKLFYDLEKIINQIKQDKEINNTIKEAQEKGYNIFKINPKTLDKLLKTKDISILKSEENYAIFKKILQKSSQEEKDFFKNRVKTLKNLKEIEESLNKIIKEIEEEIKDYNANLILTKFFEFLKFTEKQKQENKLLDFDDIIKKFLDLIKTNQKVREDIKNQFKYIFVDEAQDTDKNQTEILNQISNNNIYTFGDPKQCIYTWREADLNNYYEFTKNFQEKQLQYNYRSCPKLIEFFNIILEILEDIDQKYKKEVKPAEEEKWQNKNCHIKLITIKNQDQKTKETEAKYTVELIKQLIEEENYQFKDIMILFNKNQDIITFYNILTNYNIPVISYSTQNIFKYPEVLSLINILKYIENPNDKIAKLKVLKSPLFYKKDEDLVNRFDLEGKNAAILQHLIQKKHLLTVEQIIEKILNETDFIESIALEDNGKQKIENIKKINILSKQKTLEGLSLRDFLHFTENYEEDITIVEDEDAVKLMTIHKSKGLESKVVIIPLISLEPEKIKPNEVYIIEDEPLINLPSSKIASKKINTKEEEIKKT